MLVHNFIAYSSFWMVAAVSKQDKLKDWQNILRSKLCLGGWERQTEKKEP